MRVTHLNFRVLSIYRPNPSKSNENGPQETCLKRQELNLKKTEVCVCVFSYVDKLCKSKSTTMVMLELCKGFSLRFCFFNFHVSTFLTSLRVFPKWFSVGNKNGCYFHCLGKILRYLYDAQRAQKLAEQPIRFIMSILVVSAMSWMAQTRAEMGTFLLHSLSTAASSIVIASADVV